MLVLEEPTRGVDIGSKAEIYDILRGYAAEGHAVVLYCTEMLEVFEVAASLYVVSDGALSEPLDVSGLHGRRVAGLGRERPGAPRAARSGRRRLTPVPKGAPS